MILTNPPIVFYNRGNEIIAGVVGIPDKSKYIASKSVITGLPREGVQSCLNDIYENDLKQALIHPIPFKDQEEIRIKWCESTGYKGEGVYQQKPELGKPYKIEGEIEIKEYCSNSFCGKIDADLCEEKKSCTYLSQFAFLKPKEKSKWDGSTYPYHPNNVLVIEQKDIFDTGARLHEQKEESQGELWKDIKGFEGLYQISSFGRVKSLTRVTTSNCRVSERILIPSIHYGYLFIVLCKNSILSHHSVSRLVAIAYIPNPENKPEVNHIDSVRTSNYTWNLEWATHDENVKHAKDSGRMPNKLKREDKEEIERLVKQGIASKDVAKMYNVVPSRITAIVKRKNHRKP